VNVLQALMKRVAILLEAMAGWEEYLH